MQNSEQNKAAVRAYVEAFNQGDFDAVAKLCAPDVLIYGVLGHGGLDVAMPVWRELHHAYNIQLEIQGLIAEGDAVAARYMERGTFRNEFRGAKPNGKSYALTAMEWFTMRDGKIAQRWGARDSASIARQLADGS
jgi:steroid delta-isomerase-like uncharacterized protein